MSQIQSLHAVRWVSNHRGLVVFLGLLALLAGGIAWAVASELAPRDQILVVVIATFAAGAALYWARDRARRGRARDLEAYARAQGFKFEEQASEEQLAAAAPLAWLDTEQPRTGSGRNRIEGRVGGVEVVVMDFACPPDPARDTPTLEGFVGKPFPEVVRDVPMLVGLTPPAGGTGIRSPKPWH